MKNCFVGWVAQWRILVFASLAMLSAAVLAEGPAGYPARSIRIIVPFSPGSASDILGRTVAERLAAAWGRPVLVENRPGAGGTIGAALAAKAEPDGHTLVIVSAGHVVNPVLYRDLSYDTLNDFAGVIPLAGLPSVLAVSPALGVRSAAELVALRAHFGFHPLIAALPAIRDGRLIALAVSSSARSSALPQVPTIAEAGYARALFNFWIGLLAPAKTPRHVIARLNAQIGAILQEREVYERLTRLGAELMPMLPEQFDAFIRSEHASLAPLFKDTR